MLGSFGKIPDLRLAAGEFEFEENSEHDNNNKILIFQPEWHLCNC